MEHDKVQKIASQLKSKIRSYNNPLSMWQSSGYLVLVVRYQNRLHRSTSKIARYQLHSTKRALGAWTQLLLGRYVECCVDGEVNIDLRDMGQLFYSFEAEHLKINVSYFPVENWGFSFYFFEQVCFGSTWI